MTNKRNRTLDPKELEVRNHTKIQTFYMKLLLKRRSRVAKLSLQFALGATGFLVTTLIFRWLHFYTPVVTLVTSILIVLVGEISSAIFFILSLIVLSDYFYLPPVGSIFDSRASFEHLLIIGVASTSASILIWSLRSAFLTEITAKQEAERAKSEAELASNAMEKTLALISHDVRNPLSSVTSMTQLIQRSKDNPERVFQLSNRIIDDLERIDLMIQALLDVSRLRAGQSIALEFEYLDLQSVLSETIEDLAFSFGSRIRLIDSEPVFGTWSKDGIRRAIENLVTNAVKYGAPDAPITLSLRRESGQASIAVHNEGNEIPMDQQAQLFAAYKRGPADPHTKGWGLGLALVKGIAEAHGGTVEIRSMPGKGTTFTMVLPLRNVK